MYIYQNLEQYFGACENCGECCTIPGIFLPQEIGFLADHFRLDLETLFRSYLIAELFTPHPESIPVFLISPVRTIPNGGRHSKLLSDNQYARVRSESCIFRNSAGRYCRIHHHKPFGCRLLLCERMTKAKPIVLNKTYYYHRWLDSQAILFSIFPQLDPLYRKLTKTVFPLPAGRGRMAALAAANTIIDIEMSEVMNGCPREEGAFYRISCERQERRNFSC